MERNLFGHMADGTAVDRMTISGGGLTAQILSLGALVQDLRLDGHDGPLVLGLNSVEHYERHSPAFGITAGRYANRIANGGFELDGQHYVTDRNFLGKHTLHGGRLGFGKRNWSVTDHGANSVQLSLSAADGEMGFPGAMTATVRYSLLGDGVMRVDLTAQSDRPTVCNLIHHSYFNLSAEPTILDHELILQADHYLPVDGELIPTGEIRQTAGSEMDFTFRRPIRLMRDTQTVKYDHNFCLSDGPTAAREIGTLYAPKSSLQMSVVTNAPGVQLYTGSKVDIPVPGLDGRHYGAFAGVCLETQNWPDAPNQSQFPSARLDPGQCYEHQVDYCFRRS